MAPSSTPVEYRDLPLFFAVHDTMDIPLLISDGDRKVRWMNRAMEEWADISREQAAGMDYAALLRERIGPKLRKGAAFVRDVEAAIEQKENIRQRVCREEEGGRERWFEFTSRIVENGAYLPGRIDLFQDITAAVALKESEERQNVLQGLVAEISSLLTDTPLDGIDATVRNALARLGSGMGVARCHVFLMRADGTGKAFEYEWNAAASAPCDGLAGVTIYSFPQKDGVPDSGGILQAIRINGRLRSHAVPLRGRSLHGFLCIDATATDIPFLASNHHLLRMVGDTVTTALESREVDQGLRRHDSLCESVMNASGTLLRSGGWDENMTEILATLAGGSGAERVYLIDTSDAAEGMNLFEWHAPTVTPGFADGTREIPWHAEGMEPWSAALSLGHVITARTTDLPPRIRSLFNARNVASFAILPILAGDVCSGYLGLENCTAPHLWTKAEIEALKTAADSLGLMIYRRMKEREAERYNTQLTIINGIVGAASLPGSLDGIIRETLKKTLDLLSVPAAAVYLLDPRGREAQLHTAEGRESHRLFPEKIAREMPALAPVFAAKPVYGIALDGQEGRSAWIPLAGGGAPVGIMAVALPGGRTFATFEQQALDAAAREFGAAITRGLLQGQLKDSIDKANLYLDIMAHDIKNATTVSIMYADMLREIVTGEARDFSEKLMDSVRRTVEITDHVSTIRRLHEETPLLKPVNLDTIIKTEIARFPKTTIRYSPSSFSVCADDLVSEIFYNLIGNSVKFGGDGVEVFIRVQERQKELEITVEDSGPGIPDTMKNVIFDRFQRGSKKATGRGLGLYIVRTLIERYGGTVSVHDRVPDHPGQGASIRFTLKKAV
ncbi:MAG: PAS domain-containing protein [Methanomicrobiales archaeon]|nr:PAS domain-containing protein [Methanomicrobiales archaeon]